MTDIQGLIDRLRNGDRSNELDVLIEIALFKANDDELAVRANNAGTKVIYTYGSGEERTYRADDWAMRTAETVTALEKRLPL